MKLCPNLPVLMFSVAGYGVGLMAPGVVGIGTNSYISAHNQILAHARAYRLYQEKYLSSQGGQVGITLNIHWAEPEDPEDPTHLGTAQTEAGDGKIFCLL